MISKKRKISAVLSIFTLFSSLSFASEKSNNNLNKKVLKNNENVTNTVHKHNTHVESNNTDNSNLRWKILTGIFGTGTVLGMGGMYKLHNDIEDSKKTYDVTLNGVQQALDGVNKDVKEKDKKIEELNKTIEVMQSQSHAFSLLKQKYTFVNQLFRGRQGSTAVFKDKGNKLLVVKTLFKSGTSDDLQEIQKERKAVEYLKNKPKNDHIVLPVECFEDDNFLFVVYPYVPQAEKVTNYEPPYLLSGFKKVMTDFKNEFDKWDENEKKKFLWNITKQLFEVYKYFYENKFAHNDLNTNVLVQLKKTENLHYDDFTIKIIDWGRWTQPIWLIKTNEKYPYQPMMPSFGVEFESLENEFLYSLYDLMKIKPIEHNNNDGDKCNDPTCSSRAFFFKLDKFFGLDGGGKCERLPDYFVAGYSDKEKDWAYVYNDWVKTFKFAQNFNDLINFCQQQINEL